MYVCVENKKGKSKMKICFINIDNDVGFHDDNIDDCNDVDCNAYDD